MNKMKNIFITDKKRNREIDKIYYIEIKNFKQ